MPKITIHRRPPESSDDEPARREFLARLERVQERLARLAAAAREADAELRRQRAAGRRP